MKRTQRPRFVVRSPDGSDYEGQHGGWVHRSGAFIYHSSLVFEDAQSIGGQACILNDDNVPVPITKAQFVKCMRILRPGVKKVEIWE